jgi:hypothetical protein
MHGLLQLIGFVFLIIPSMVYEWIFGPSDKKGKRP